MKAAYISNHGSLDNIQIGEVDDIKIGSNDVLWIVLFLAIFPSLSAFAIQLVAQKFVSPVRVSLILAFEPVFAVLFAWTLGNEPYSFQKAMGGFFIFAALVISGIPSRPVLRKN